MSLDSEMEALRALHPDGSFNIGRLHGHGWIANVHFNGSCWGGSGKTPSASFDDALASYRRACPDKITAARNALADAHRRLREAEERAAELGIAA